MGQVTPFKPIAIVVEDDVFQRAEVATLLEECEMGVIECGSAEEALRVVANPVTLRLPVGRPDLSGAAGQVEDRPVGDQVTDP